MEVEVRGDGACSYIAGLLVPAFAVRDLATKPPHFTNSEGIFTNFSALSNQLANFRSKMTPSAIGTLMLLENG